MKYEQHQKVLESARAYACKTERGVRNMGERRDALVMSWLKRECRRKTSKARYIVYETRTEYGSKWHPDRRPGYSVYDMGGSDMHETEKSYVFVDKYGYKKVIGKKKVIGYLD